MLNGTGVAASAVEGAQSQFDVIADGALVFSKQAEGRFPEEDEILALVR
ncbi:MAG: Rdx family protein [Actinomycetota bacterium]|nr:Rdx family protein [Actinomycetota bacterium]